MARKKKHEEHVNHERWLVSYADFITLLFAFFTSLYAISTVDAKKVGKMMFSTRAAFNLDFFQQSTPTQGSTAPAQMIPKDNVKLTPEKIIFDPKQQNGGRGPGTSGGKGVEKVAQHIAELVARNNLQDKVSVKVSGQGLVVSITEAAMFEPGGAEIRPSSLPLFDRIISALVESGQMMRIEGHTDDERVKGKFRSNWELSAARAVNVVTYVSEEFAYPSELLSFAGYANYKPIASNETLEGRSRNRRVDIMLLGQPPEPAIPTNPAP